MKKLKLALLFLGISILCCAQKNDYVWLQGYDHGFNSTNGLTFGTTVFDFNYSPLQISYDSLNMNFDFTSTSFCDSNGNLIFYTNGIYIANSLGEKIENSDSLNIAAMAEIFDPTMLTYGYRTPGGVYIIPVIGQEDKYYILHIVVDRLDNLYQGTHFLVTFLDMTANNGHGKVIYKNQSIISDTISQAFALVRHANGRDWWGLVQKRNSNCYYRILIDSAGVHALPDLTCTGFNIPTDWVGPLTFTPDGTKFIYLSAYGGLNIYDFDRCSGTISNPQHLALPPVVISSGWNGFGLSISPNDRFLYVSLTYYLFQYDLWATDIFASIDTVAIFDNTYMPNATVFAVSQAGPDGKIYISGEDDTVYHVIERPDEKGDSCLVRPHSLNLPSVSLGVPNFPNYRLGALSGSACDTLTGLNEIARAAKEKILKLFPNPATTDVVIDYGFTDWSKPGEVSLEIVNSIGQKVLSQALPQYSGFQKVDVLGYTSGIYTVFIKRKEQLIASAKLAKD